MLAQHKVQWNREASSILGSLKVMHGADQRHSQMCFSFALCCFANVNIHPGCSYSSTGNSGALMASAGLHGMLGGGDFLFLRVIL